MRKGGANEFGYCLLMLLVATSTYTWRLTPYERNGADCRGCEATFGEARVGVLTRLAERSAGGRQDD
jgi:hypothetical protein